MWDKIQVVTYAMGHPVELVGAVAGIDWGGGGTSRTVLVIGYMRDDYHFVVCLFEWFAAGEDPEQILAVVAQRCAEFRIRVVAADGGGNGPSTIAFS
jgi:hypothetical protein